MIRHGDRREVEGFQRAAEGASPFEKNPIYERLLELRERDPQAFALQTGTAARAALASYEAAKRKAQESNG